MLFNFHMYSLDETLGDYYYFNFETGETQWNHPLDKVYCEKIIEARKTLPKYELTAAIETKQISQLQNSSDKSAGGGGIKFFSKDDQSGNNETIQENQHRNENITSITNPPKVQEMNITA